MKHRNYTEEDGWIYGMLEHKGIIAKSNPNTGEVKIWRWSPTKEDSDRYIWEDFKTDEAVIPVEP